MDVRVKECYRNLKRVMMTEGMIRSWRRSDRSTARESRGGRLGRLKKLPASRELGAMRVIKTVRDCRRSKARKSLDDRCQIKGVMEVSEKSVRRGVNDGGNEGV